MFYGIFCDAICGDKQKAKPLHWTTRATITTTKLHATISRLMEGGGGGNDDGGIVGGLCKMEKKNFVLRRLKYTLDALTN